jgi:hypothetical protein
LGKLQPKTFFYDTNNMFKMNFSSALHYGFIAEDVQRVLPEIVKTVVTPVQYDSAGRVVASSVTFSAIDYNEFTAILTSAVQQQQQSIDSLRNKCCVRIVPVQGTTGGLATDSAGNIRQLAMLQAASFTTCSDIRYKTNVQSISNALSEVEQLNGVYFNWNQAAFPKKNFPSGQQVGFIAQEVNSIAPQVVTKDDSGYYAVDYGRITPLLVNAIKQQQQTIDSLRNIMNSMHDCINRLCNSDRSQKPGGDNSGNDTNETNVTLSNSALLYQNIPNPFSTGTKINYYLPTGTVGAMMVFYDMYGNKLKEVMLDKTGAGTLNVTPDNLGNGMYSYSLIINGQVIDTKKMVLNR